MSQNAVQCNKKCHDLRLVAKELAEEFGIVHIDEWLSIVERIESEEPPELFWSRSGWFDSGIVSSKDVAPDVDEWRDFSSEDSSLFFLVTL